MTPPGVVVVGTGSIGRRHMANLLALGATDVVACSEHRRLPTVEVSGTELPCVHDFDDALQGPQPVVLVANPSIMHASYARRALRAGKHVLIEKPLAVDLASALGVVGDARLAGTTAGVVQQLRFHPLLPALVEHLEGGAIGRPVTIEARQGEHLADYHPDEDLREGYAARRSLGGGVLLTQIHLVDLVCHLFGRPSSVTAAEGPRLLGLDVEESVSFIARRGDDAAVYAHVDFHARPRRFVIDVVGDAGRITWDYYASTLRAVDAAGSETLAVDTPFDRDNLFRAVLVDFFDAISDGRPPRCSVADAIGPLAVVDAVRTSTPDGRTVDVSDCGSAP